MLMSLFSPLSFQDIPILPIFLTCPDVQIISCYCLLCWDSLAIAGQKNEIQYHGSLKSEQAESLRNDCVHNVVGCNSLILSHTAKESFTALISDSCSIFDMWSVCGQFGYSSKYYQLRALPLSMFSILTERSYFSKGAWRTGISSQFLKKLIQKASGGLLLHQEQTPCNEFNLSSQAQNQKALIHAPRSCCSTQAVTGWRCLLLECNEFADKFADPPSFMHHIWE